ncbi:hypothetical protein GYMLUDRAFT_89423 [Collybiopsis luxurians FD-317 M1]|nr:hypothetical protein GYMLUDRAFT_89423 [Collybiopsis luxurians FD-317 M1]
MFAESYSHLPCPRSAFMEETQARDGTARHAPPYGLKWRSSYWFVTFVVGLGVANDILVYSIFVPVLPFQLQKLGYTAISVRTSWLLFSYSAGLVVSTLPVAMFSEKYSARKAPLVLGILVLIGSIIMLMEAPVYWLMCLARVLQGIGSTMVWVVGLALLCDMTPTNLIGRQLGLSMTGMSIGLLIGPPVGGALYSRFGFRGPCIVGIIAAVLDLTVRLMIIEQKEAVRWKQDHLSISENEMSGRSTAGKTDTENNGDHSPPDHQKETLETQDTQPLSLLSVITRFSKSSRANTATFLTLIFGILYSCIEPTLPLRMQSSFGFNSSKVGLVFLAAVIPSFFSGPLTGYIADRYGTSWITLASLVSSMPWWGLMIIDGNLALFITSFALSSLLLSGTLSPLMAELAAVSRSIDGVGYAHVNAAFNLAYGVGSAIGPVIGGQMYDHITQGWMALCLLAIGLLGLGFILTFFYIGEKPVFRQLMKA